MRIPQNIIQEVQQASDIIEVVSDFVTLKKKGKDYKACCPFHNEKTPSFSVSPSRNIFKCFGCGKGGDAVTFVMEIESISYVEAIKYLAKKYNIEIPEEALQKPTDEELEAQNEKDSILIALNYAKNFFREQLTKTDEGKTVGLSYFKERGFNEKTQDVFELGYSPETWDALFKEMTQKGFKPQILEKAGLSIHKENSSNYFDRFRDRVIFPIHNVSGRIIGFGGRTLRKDKNIAKYINSPETLVYHKSNVLYGLFQAKQAIRQEDYCYLVEGYSDVISLYQAGIHNVVASSGTSLTHEQIRLMRRFTTDVTILYDGDEAGLKASMRGIDVVLEEGLNVKIVVFPNGEDPDSYVQKIGVNEFKKFVQENSKDFITFKTELLLKDVKNDPFKRAEAIKEVVNSIIKIPDAIQRMIFFQDCSNLFQVEENVLIAEGNKILKNPKGAGGNQTQTIDKEIPVSDPLTESLTEKGSQVNPLYFQEQESVRLLLNYADHQIGDEVFFTQYVLDEMGDIHFETPVYQKILTIFREELKKGNIISANFFLQHNSDAELKNAVIDLITEKHEVSEGWQKREVRVPKKDELLHDVTYTHLIRLKFRFVQKMITENLKKLQKAESAEEQEKYMMIHQELKTTEKEIAGILGNVIR